MALDLNITDIDRRFYAEQLQAFLPQRLIDIHTHVWRDADFPPPALRTEETRSVTWPARVARDNPLEDLQETYRLMLPGKQVTPLIFATLPRGGNLEAQNAYVADCTRHGGVPALVFSDPTWSAEELEARVKAGGFVGAKSYLSLAPAHLPAKDITIFDFFPRHQLALHNRHGWIVMLHLPRDGRLKDPVNLEQLLQIEREFPNLKVIVAHVGRAYCDHDVGNAFEVLAATRRLMFDFSANTNAKVFEQLLRAVGPRRVLFGSDMPILRMRMRRITVGDHYVNLVPKGLYGDVSGDRNMGEVEGDEAARLTFFLYEELAAFRTAAVAANLTPADVADVFYGNAARILAEAGWVPGAATPVASASR